MEASKEGRQSDENEGVESAVPSDASRKLRILCLHGFRTSGRVMSQQIAIANWGPLMDDVAELVFLDAPWPARGKSDTATEKNFTGPYFEWFHSNEEFSVVYGLDQAMSYLSNYVAAKRPFDGFLGFSQGGILAAALMGLSQKGTGPKIADNFKFVIVIGSGRQDAEPFLPAYEDAITCPSLHFIGDKDFMKPLGESLADAFKDPVVIRHPFGHVFPRLGASQAQIFRNFLRNQLQSKFPSHKGKYPTPIPSLL